MFVSCDKFTAMSRISFSKLSVVILLMLSYLSLSFDINKKGNGACDNLMKSVRKSRTNALKMKCYIKEISIQSLKLLPNDNIYYKVICRSSDGVNYDWNIEKDYKQFDEFQDTCNNYFDIDRNPLTEILVIIIFIRNIRRISLMK